MRNNRFNKIFSLENEEHNENVERLKDLDHKISSLLRQEYRENELDVNFAGKDLVNHIDTRCFHNIKLRESRTFLASVSTNES